jgi:6,7-dimethyl-8-ribityllumazine synthase
MTTPLRATPKDAAGTLRLGIIQSRFNEDITAKLLEGALRELESLGVSPNATKVLSVPGAIEIPVAAQALCKHGNFDAIIALGAVIRGETSHYDYVCSMVADGCMRVSLDQNLPIVFGVLTCDNEEQALARVQPGTCHKGEESAQVAVEMVNLLREIRS